MCLITLVWVVLRLNPGLLTSQCLLPLPPCLPCLHLACPCLPLPAAAVDIALPEERIALEVDGPHHFTANTFKPTGDMYCRWVGGCTAMSCGGWLGTSGVEEAALLPASLLIACLSWEHLLLGRVLTVCTHMHACKCPTRRCWLLQAHAAQGAGLAGGQPPLLSLERRVR